MAAEENRILLDETKPQPPEIHRQMREQFEVAMQSAPRTMVIFYERADGSCVAAAAGSVFDIIALHELASKGLAEMINRARLADKMNG